MPKRAGPKPKTGRGPLRIVITLVPLVLLGLLVWWLHRPDLVIDTIVITTPQPEKTDALYEYLENRMREPLLFGFTKRGHKSLIRTDDLSQDILRLFPVFATAEVGRVHTQITVAVTSRTPSALWCELRASQHESCWFMDNDHVVYQSAPHFSDGVYVKYTSSAYDTPAIGAPILTDELRPFAADIKKVFSQADLDPVRIHIAADDRIEIYIQKINQKKLSNTAHIIVSNRQTIDEITERVALLLATKEFIAELSAAPGEFRYADLRFPGRLVYKMDND